MQARGVVKTKIAVVGAGPVGLFMSNLLKNVCVPHVLVERRTVDQIGAPKAHYLNGRSMEILRTSDWNSFTNISLASTPSLAWRDFVYCHTVTGTELGRQDNFKLAPSSHWSQSPATVTHIAQNQFERILQQSSALNMHVEEDPCYFGYQASILSHDSKGVSLQLDPQYKSTRDVKRDALQIYCDFVVAADGAQSDFRTKLGIHMEGKVVEQHVMHVHFSCPGLHEKLSTRPGMLYFTYNETMIAMFVTHDVQRDEWVCQIPFSAPHQLPQDFPESRVLEMLKAGLFASTPDGEQLRSKLGPQIKILHSTHWTMHADVASHFVDPQHHRVFLVGDAAHRFPAVGGFGLNIGLQGAHNLAWRLAHATKENSLPSHQWVGKSYEKERRKIAMDYQAVTERSNALVSGAATTLGVDPSAFHTLSSIAKFLPYSMQNSFFNRTADLALARLKALQDFGTNEFGKRHVAALHKKIKDKQVLPLIFPSEDLAFSYLEAFPEDAHLFVQQPGRRVDHQWLLLTPKNAGKQCVVSTVDLPQVAWNALSARSTAVASPPFVVLLPKTTDDRVLSALRALLTTAEEFACLKNKLVAVAASSRETASTAAVRELLDVDLSACPADQWHAAVQGAAQVPRFDVDRSHAEQHIVGGYFRWAALKQEKKEELKNTASQNFARTKNVLVGRDGDLFTHDDDALPVVEGVNLSAALAQEIVLIRPDGHVVLVSAVDVSANKILQAMKAELGY